MGGFVAKKIVIIDGHPDQAGAGFAAACREDKDATAIRIGPMRESGGKAA